MGNNKYKKQKLYGQKYPGNSVHENDPEREEAQVTPEKSQGEDENSDSSSSDESETEDIQVTPEKSVTGVGGKKRKEPCEDNTSEDDVEYARDDQVEYKSIFQIRFNLFSIPTTNIFLLYIMN